MNSSRTVRFAFNVMNSTKKNIWAVKNIFHRLSGEIFVSPPKRFKTKFNATSRIHRKYIWRMWQMPQWNENLLTSRRREVQTRVWQFLFCEKSSECVGKNCSPLKTAKMAASNAKRCGRFAVKKIFFHRYSPQILHYFLTKPRTGLYTSIFRHILSHFH